jgi:hypothetical protein
VKLSLVAAVLPLAVLVACTPEVAETPPAEDPAAQAAIERLMGLETCEDATTHYGSMLPQLTTCRLELGEGKPRFVISSDQMIESETESMGILRAELSGEGGLSLQVIEETASGAFNYPYVEDLTGDGAADLMVPLMTGNVNTAYALWVQGADGLFKRAGELSGVGVGLAPNGFIAASGRSSAVEWETQYFRVTDGALEEVAAVVSRADPEPGEPPLEGPACEVIRIIDGIDPAPLCEDEGDQPG